MEPGEQLAVAVARLEDLRTEVRSLRDEVRRQHGDVVARNEWMQRNAYVDGKFDDQGKDIAELRSDLSKRTPQWWMVAPAVVAVASLVLTIIVTLTGR